MPLTIEFRDERARQKIARLRAGLTPEATDPIVQQVAMRTWKTLVMKTPKGFTGQTRRDWRVHKRTGLHGAGVGYIVTNRSKVMRFLEEGTKAHGPVTAKFLYIPLNRKAAIGGWNPSLQIGTDYILQKRVKGIKAMRIVAKQRPITARWMHASIRAHVRNLLSG